MVAISKKSSPDNHAGVKETVDGSGGYDELSDESVNEEGASVSDFEGDDPKRVPEVCFFSDTACRKVFQLKGDAEKGIERVCGIGIGICVRTGHGEERWRVGPIGFYDTTKTARKVDGILSTHRS